MNSKLPSTKISETPLLDKTVFTQPCSRTFILTRSHTSSPPSIPSSSAITIRIILPILKPGSDPSPPVSLRPIALSSVLGKLFQKILNKRLLWYLEFDNVLSPSQYGLRKAHRHFSISKKKRTCSLPQNLSNTLPSSTSRNPFHVSGDTT